MASQIVIRAYDIKVPARQDCVTECIDAISQVMEQAKLSANGKDKRAVYAWFVERYRPGVILPNISED